MKQSNLWLYFGIIMMLFLPSADIEKAQLLIFILVFLAFAISRIERLIELTNK